MADKKITELPFIDNLSGSLVGTNTPLQNTVIPIVLRGNTNQINIEDFSKFVTAYSAHTGSAGNIFTGPQTINNNVTINGRLTVREVVAEYETASILFSTGSTKLGDELTDKHEFTGSTNITGALYYNDVLVTNIDSNTIERLQQATASLQIQSGSQDLVNLGISSVTGSINTTTSSFYGCRCTLKLSYKEEKISDNIPNVSPDQPGNMYYDGKIFDLEKVYE
jgi:hypothetical protein